MSWAAPFAKVLSKIAPTYRTKFLAKLLKAAKQPNYQLLNRQMGFSPSELKQLLKNKQEAIGFTNQYHKTIWDKYFKSDESLLKNVLRASLDTRLVNDYLVKVDRATMAASLEMRSPFLDRQLAEFAFTLHPKQLFYSDGTKSILKKLSEKYLPKELIYRHKMGFGVPIAEWFRNDLKKDFEGIVLDGQQNLIDLDYSFIQNMFSKHCSETKSGKYAHRLWSLYVFHIWAQKLNANEMIGH